MHNNDRILKKMAPRTRKAKEEDGEEIVEEIKPAALPKDDLTYSRKFVVSQENSLANSKILKLRHPKGGFALFHISEKCFDEILSVNEGNRSWFYGDSVIENGAINLFAPFNPVFWVLPYLYKNRTKFLEGSEILTDDGLGAEIYENVKFLAAMEKVADFKDAIDTKVFRLNEEKMLKWISGRFDILKEKLSEEVHKSLLENSDAYDRYVFSFLSDFLIPEINQRAKEYLNIKEAPATEVIDMSMKRKIMTEDDELLKPVVKKAKESVTAKKLQAASKGTKSISSFFGKK